MNQRKCLLMTWFRNYNYGTFLQAYALTDILQTVFDVDVYMAEFEIKGDRDLASVIRKLCSVQTYKKRIDLRVCGRKFERHVPELKQLRCKTFDEAVNIYFKLANNGRRVASKEEWDRLGTEFDIYMAGSDQIWNPKWLNTRFLLDFVTRGTKLSYGSSLCAERIPDEKKSTYQKYLSDFKAISIREEACRQQLSQITGKPVKSVVDPCVLYGREAWDQILRNKNTKAQFDSKKDDVFVYFLGNNVSHREMVLELAKKNDFKIIQIPHMSLPSYSDADELMQGKATWIMDVSPFDFIRHIKEAKYVITDSFHATVFSVLYHKPFCVCVKDQKSMEQNNRIESFLEIAGLQNHFLKENSLEKCEKCLYENTDWNLVDERVARKRVDSMRWLEAALGGSYEDNPNGCSM